MARDGVVLRQDVGDPAISQAARLPRDLMRLLAAVDIRLADIDVYAVAIGPGSFTGMRVGIATMQGLAFAAGKPLIGVSTLDALAHAAFHASGAEPGKDGHNTVSRVSPWVDAWRGEIYAALYEDGLEVESPMLAHPEAVLTRFGLRWPAGPDAIGAAEPPVLFIGDGANTHRDLIARTRGRGAAFATPVAPALAGVITTLAAAAVHAGQAAPPHAIRPLYVRRAEEPVRDGRPAE